jgi:hypothetical protein
VLTERGATVGRAAAEPQRLPRWLVILLVSLAGLLLEVGYTRIISYKLWYYYTYLVIGLALLGIGSGSVFVAIYSPMRRWSTDRIIGVCAIGGAISIALGELIVALVRIDTVVIWDYGTGHSFANLFRLAVVCFAIFATFLAFGVIVAVLLGRAGEGVGRIYFSDLVGAGLGALLAIPLISRLGPPRVIMLAALVFAIVGVASFSPRSPLFGLSAIVSVALVIMVVATSVLPAIRPEPTKVYAPNATYSAWGPVFRVDVVPVTGDSALLLHDATFGSAIHRFDGNPTSLSSFTQDPRSLPFKVLAAPPARELIIGSAGGNEILSSLYYHAPNIEAVELNPVTVSLLREHFAGYTGHLTKRRDVHLHQGDGRSYLARHKNKYDLVWYVAPDSYAATNAASSGALVLSESYLYTTQIMKETLRHLTPDGIMVAQFGELTLDRPNRTSRYIVTARKALEQLGIADPSRHLLVSALTTKIGALGGALSTIVVKRTPFTAAEVARFRTGVASLPDQKLFAAPGEAIDRGVVSRLASGNHAEVATLVANYEKNITAISDDAPYFWHFTRFRKVIANIDQPFTTNDREDVIGERVLLLMLAIAAVYAAVFLLVPFVAVRRTWRALPAKGTSAVYFSALGLGFMFFEITMIQRLVQFLGYPTYSLTVTLAAILVSTGLGALLSQRFVHRARVALPSVVGVVAALTVFYQLALPRILTGPLLSTGLSVRIAVAVAVLTPLGLCLGMFMPLGLGRVVGLTPHGEEYVAWAWAVNGFFSVIGAVLTTILSMAFGFRLVQLAALGLYVISGVAFTRLPATPHSETVHSETGDIQAREPQPSLVPRQATFGRFTSSWSARF